MSDLVPSGSPSPRIVHVSLHSGCPKCPEHLDTIRTLQIQIQQKETFYLNAANKFTALEQDLKRLETDRKTNEHKITELIKQRDEDARTIADLQSQVQTLVRERQQFEDLKLLADCQSHYGALLADLVYAKTRARNKESWKYAKEKFSLYRMCDDYDDGNMQEVESGAFERHFLFPLLESSGFKLEYHESKQGRRELSDATLDAMQVLVAQVQSSCDPLKGERNGRAHLSLAQTIARIAEVRGLAEVVCSDPGFEQSLKKTALCLVDLMQTALAGCQV